MRSNRVTAERVRMRQERSQGTVSAKVTENIQAGLGVSSIVIGFSLLGYTWRNWGAMPEPVRIIALAIALGLIWFGALSCIRFSVDEVRDLYQWYRLQESLVDERMKVEQLKADNRELRQRLRQAESQIKTQEFNKASAGAREVVKPDKYAELKRDIEELIDRWAQGAKFGRDHCAMGRARWERATRFLVDSGAMVVSSDGRQSRQFEEGVTRSQIDKRVRDAFARIEKYEGTNFTPALS